jgi:hypothetical protein
MLQADLSLREASEKRIYFDDFHGYSKDGGVSSFTVDEKEIGVYVGRVLGACLGL